MLRATALGLALAAAAPAAAHEVEAQVVRGRAVAVRATYADGAPLADVEYQVFAPGDEAAPWQEGWTDRDGWLAFVPSGPGAWRVKVADASGHGVAVDVDAGAAAEPGRDPARAGRSPLRGAAGAAVIVAAFALLYLLRRKRS